jgi:2-polyprenyl-3-methyl-5-hydroxy-6-metoxy-1,4-benzoquinol methylase
MASIYDILNEVKGYDPAYEKKMIHPIPLSTVVDRVKFILNKCKDKTVLDIGCAANKIHLEIQKVAKVAYGVDKEKVDYNHFYRADLDKLHSSSKLPDLDNIDIIVCGELLEHLSNPGIFLQKLKKYKAQILITVPNAHCEAGYLHVKNNTENVNIDHVAYYTWRTLKTLVERFGYEVKEFYWYNGKERISEGLIMLVE